VQENLTLLSWDPYMGKLCSWELFIQETLHSMIKCFSNEFVV